MRARVLLAVAVLTDYVLCARQIKVSVCNSGALTESVLRRAKAETQAAFRSSQITIEWSDCRQVAGSHSFIVRLRADKPPRTAGPSSLDTMGRAFLAEDGSGTLADAYIQSVRDISNYHGADAAVVLGLVIAHELGHLLLGPGHTPNGVMRWAWGSRELKALSQRSLSFDRDQRAKILSRVVAISSGTGPPPATPSSSPAVIR